MQRQVAKWNKDITAKCMFFLLFAKLENLQNHRHSILSWFNNLSTPRRRIPLSQKKKNSTVNSVITIYCVAELKPVLILLRVTLWNFSVVDFISRTQRLNKVFIFDVKCHPSEIYFCFKDNAKEHCYLDWSLLPYNLLELKSWNMIRDGGGKL